MRIVYSIAFAQTQHHARHNAADNGSAAQHRTNGCASYSAAVDGAAPLDARATVILGVTLAARAETRVVEALATHGAKRAARQRAVRFHRRVVALRCDATTKLCC